MASPVSSPEEAGSVGGASKPQEAASPQSAASPGASPSNQSGEAGQAEEPAPDAAKNTNADADADADAAGLEEDHEVEPNLGPVRILQVAVSSSSKVGEGLSQYTVYQVDSLLQPLEGPNQPIPGSGADAERKEAGDAEPGHAACLEPQSFCVPRRYSDFLWLHGVLAHAHPECLIPPLPEKNVLARLSKATVDARQVALDHFVKDIARHPALAGHPAVGQFLRLAVPTPRWTELRAREPKTWPLADDESLREPADPDNPDAAAPEKPAGAWASFLSSVRGAFSSSGGSGGGASPKNSAHSDPELEEPGADVLESAADDRRCRLLAVYLEGLRKELDAAREHYGVLLQEQRAMSRHWFSFGEACGRLSSREQSASVIMRNPEAPPANIQQSLAGSWTQLGLCSDRMHHYLEVGVPSGSPGSAGADPAAASEEAESLSPRFHTPGTEDGSALTAPLMEYLLLFSRYCREAQRLLKRRAQARAQALQRLELRNQRRAKYQFWLDMESGAVGPAERQQRIAAGQAMLVREDRAAELARLRLARFGASLAADIERFLRRKQQALQWAVGLFARRQVSLNQAVLNTWQVFGAILQVSPPGSPLHQGQQPSSAARLEPVEPAQQPKHSAAPADS